MDSITSQMQQIYQNLQSRISQLDSELQTMLSHRYYGQEFNQKEKEIRKLKAELEQIESERQRPTLFTTSPPLPPLSPAFHPFAPMLSPIKPQDPSKLFGMTHTLFRNNPLPKPSRSKPHPRPRPEKQPFQPPLSTSEQQPPLYTPLPPQPTPTHAKDKSPMQQYNAQLIPDPSDTDQTSDSNLAVSEDPSEPESKSSVETSLSSSDSEKSYADITRILMAQPEETKHAQSSRTDPFFEIPSYIEEDAPEASSAPNQPAQPPNDHKPSNGPWFTFDDIPASKWRDKLSEMAAWTDLQMLRANATTTSVLRELVTRFTGSLRDWFFRKRSSSFREQKRRKSSRCFICKKKGHYAKDCPNKKDKAIRLLEHLQATTDCSPHKDEIEFYFSEQEEPTDETVFALQNSSDDYESDEFQTVFHQQLLSLDTTIPIPSIKLHILPSKFQRPIPTIGLLDTGSQRSMLNPDILPSQYWQHSEEIFKAVNGKFFTTQLITKKSIGIQIFPNCVIWTKVIGSHLPNKDILLGFDIIHQIKHLQIIPTGIRVKSMFKPFTNVLKLYGLFESSQPFQDISTKFLKYCPESHADFHHPNPLWKNPHFFVQLPFKLNEDVNPTKATHPGMSPSDLVLAQKECSQLLAQGLIEPTSSQWACQAFYVEKHFEIMATTSHESTLLKSSSTFQIRIFPKGKFSDENHQGNTIKTSSDPLHIHGGPITRAKAKKMKAALNGLIEKIWIENAIQDARHHELGLKRRQGIVGIIQVIGQPNTQFVSNAERDFIPHVDHHTRQLSTLLKKNPPSWNNNHTLAVTTLKQIAQNPPPLKLITDGRRILQTDASDESWGAILLDETDGKEQFHCGIHIIQQFLGIINYIGDFIPHVDHHTRQLSALLKKNPPSWNNNHTLVVTTLKQIAQNPPPLKLITDGRRILQTDASDESWGAILLDETDGKEQFHCGIHIIQQFLGIINYIGDFIPHVDHHTRQLSALLKKNPPSWNNNHTLVVTTLKQIAQNPPPLKLITDGRRILQTDASDESWGAILLDETDGKEQFHCGIHIIQQFLGIINYIGDFIPHVDHHTRQLSALLKKNPPSWNNNHTLVVTTLKQIAQNPPSLKLITDGRRILQTDASDESWGAILLDETDGKEHFIAHASGHFSDTQIHYHSVFKEILAVKHDIQKFEYHLIGYHFLVKMDNLAFPNIMNFKGKNVPEKMLLRLKHCFSKYDFSVNHIKGDHNLIPDMLSRLAEPEKSLFFISSDYHFPIIFMATSLPSQALTQKTFPLGKTFTTDFAIQEFAKKIVFRFFMKAYLLLDSFPFSTFHPENLFLTGLTLDPSRDIFEDELWYIWCLTVLYATKLIVLITYTLDHLLNPDKSTSLLWTLLEWFSLIPWWRMKLQQLSQFHNLDRLPTPEAKMFTFVFIIHRPYFQHPDTHFFWTQDQVFEWFTTPHPSILEQDDNFLCELNHQPAPHKDISHTSLGPRHDIIMIPTPSAILKSKSTGIIINEEKPDFTNFLYQDAQDPWEAFLPLSQHLQNLQQTPPSHTSDDPTNKASSSKPPASNDHPSSDWCKIFCPYPPCCPDHQHPPETPRLSLKVLFSKGKDETDRSSDEDYMNLSSP
ncbi:hypothetical protein KPL70_001124 [Citrus sinensis]|nr:hypothetical protein KPL70_001124 [Citrus sinensis]